MTKKDLPEYPFGPMVSMDPDVLDALRRNGMEVAAVYREHVAAGKKESEHALPDGTRVKCVTDKLGTHVSML